MQIELFDNLPQAIAGEGFKAVRGLRDRWHPEKGFQWSLSIHSPHGYKTGTHYRAEEAGVRYASHRKGYVASERAFRKFIELMAA